MAVTGREVQGVEEVEVRVEERQRKGMLEEGAGGVMEEESACSLCGRAFGNEEEDAGEGEVGVDEDEASGDVVEEEEALRTYL